MMVLTGEVLLLVEAPREVSTKKWRTLLLQFAGLFLGLKFFQYMPCSMSCRHGSIVVIDDMHAYAVRDGTEIGDGGDFFLFVIRK